MDKILKLINAFYVQFKRFPTFNQIKSRVSSPESQLKEVLDKMVEKGFLAIKNNQYFILRDTANKTYPFLKVIIAYVCLIASGFSIFYSSIWFNNFLPLPLAILFASGFVLYGIASPTLFRATKETTSLKWWLLVTGLIVIIFSIISTVAGQYKADTMDTKNSQRILNEGAIKIYNEEKNQTKRSLISIEKEITQSRKMLSLDKKDKSVFWKLWRLKKTRKEYEKRLRELNKKIIGLSKVKKKENYSFYHFIASILKAPEKIIKFWFYLFPALFIDIIAPLALLSIKKL